MNFKRRDFLKVLPLSVLFPSRLVYSRSTIQGQKTIETGFQQTAIDELYDNAIVIDGLVIPRGWDEDSFEALAMSGYTGFNTSLSSGNLNSALRSLDSWQKRIKENSDRLIYTTSMSPRAHGCS